MTSNIRIDTKDEWLFELAEGEAIDPEEWRLTIRVGDVRLAVD